MRIVGVRDHLVRGTPSETRHKEVHRRHFVEQYRASTRRPSGITAPQQTQLCRTNPATPIGTPISTCSCRSRSARTLAAAPPLRHRAEQ
jgi:hypothetical protein